MSFKPARKRPLLLRKPYIFIWPVVIVVAMAAVLYEATDLFKTRVAVSGSAYTKGENAPTPGVKAQAQSKGSSTNSSSSSALPGDNKNTGTDGNSTATLVAPTGDFVSNHHPNLSGSPAPDTLNSVCTTTPGATCAISFTKDGVTKSLPTETTDRGGSAYWNGWSLQSIGLTIGSWQVQASASLNGKTLGASDALQLVVSQ